MVRTVLLLSVLLGTLALVLVPAPATLRGRVVDLDHPLAGALVRVKGSPQNTHTGADGSFSLIAFPSSRLTAWKPGFRIGGTRGSARPLELCLEPLPTEDHVDYPWVDPTPLLGDETRCGNCHPTIWREWAGSGHSRSATGIHFRNLYDGGDWHGKRAGWSLLDEHPDGAGVCASCHAPTVREDDPALFDLRQIRGVDARGVHCDFCHKVAGPAPGDIGLTHGRYLLKLLRPRQGQLFFGPLDDVDRGEDAYSPFYKDSRYCAACHEGTLFGVPVYTTYSEWLRSPARTRGLHCQDCHLRPTGRMRNIAPGKGGIERDPWTLGNHHFWDGSQVEMLRRGLRLDVRSTRAGTEVNVVVRLAADGVGHRVPTGYIDRQLLLVVEGFDRSGRGVMLRRGGILSAAAGPQLAGLPGRSFARRTRDEKGRGPVPFWRAVPEVEDTRLVPGRADERTFTFASNLNRVRVRVIHRRFWAEVTRSKGWPDTDLLVFDRESGIE